MSLLKSNKFWIVLVIAVLLISTAAVLLLTQGRADMVSIYLDGERIEHLDLSAVSEPYSFTVEHGSEISIISVEKGRIRMSESNCYDEICVHQGWVSGGAVPIICLPHRLVIQFESSRNTLDVDVIVG